MNAPGDARASPVGPERRPLKLRRRQRLSLANDFQAILKGKLSRPSGPLVVYARPNTLDVHRLGLSVGRRVGNAVMRNRIKRRLREAFRHVQHTIPCAGAAVHMDMVIVVRPHDPLSRTEYEQLLIQAGAKLVTDLDRRAARARSRDDAPGAAPEGGR